MRKSVRRQRDLRNKRLESVVKVVGGSWRAALTQDAHAPLCSCLHQARGVHSSPRDAVLGSQLLDSFLKVLLGGIPAHFPARGEVLSS